VIAIQKKIVIDENGVPLEVIIPWAQYCEMSEALGLDLDDEAMADLRATREDVQKGDAGAFTPLSEL
jgi:PHD/YefM family antitoxin component YafN of YafNO toxin-antitoxin module